MPPPQPEPNPEEDSLPLDHSHILLSSFNSFLTIAIHNILYYRNIYPPSTFLSTKAYNLPVHQNRHPKVCAWIRDAVDAVAAQLATGHVSRVAIVIHAPLEPPLLNPSSASQTPSQQQPSTIIPPGAVLERWLIDTSHFPAWPSTTTATTTSDTPNPNPTGTTTTNSTTNPTTGSSSAKAMRDFARVLARDARSEDARERHLGAADTHNPGLLAWPDLDEQLRGALRRMAGVAEGMAPLEGYFPFSNGGNGGGAARSGSGSGSGCTFTVAVELGEEGRAPIGVCAFFLLLSFLLFWVGLVLEGGGLLTRMIASPGVDTVGAKLAARGQRPGGGRGGYRWRADTADQGGGGGAAVLRVLGRGKQGEGSVDEDGGGRHPKSGVDATFLNYERCAGLAFSYGVGHDTQDKTTTTRVFESCQHSCHGYACSNIE